MKRILSLFLSTVLVLSMIFGTFTTGVYAEVTGGSFSTVPYGAVKSFTEDFDTWRNEYWSARTANQNAVIDSESNQLFKVTSRTTYYKDDGTTTNSSKMLLATVETKPGDAKDKYLKLTDYAEDNSFHGRFYFSTGAVTPSEDETMLLSVDLMAEDSNYRKLFGVSDHLNTDMMSDVKRIVEFSSDGNILVLDNDTGIDYTDNKWYHFDFLWTNSEVECYIDNELIKTLEKGFSSYISPTYKFTGLWITHQKNDRKSLYTPDLADASFCVDNLSATVFSENTIADAAPAITSIGADGKVAYDATELSFTIDSPLDALKAEHLEFTPENSATSIEVTDNENGTYTVKAQLAQSLIPWTDYSLELDRACFGGKEIILDASGFPKAIETLSASFSVTAAPFALKAPEFVLEGDTLTANTVFVNNTADEKYAYFMLLGKDENGVLKNVATASKKDITTNENGVDVSLELSDFTSGTAELIVIDGYTNAPLFDVMYAYNYDGSTPETDEPVATSDAKEGEIVLGDFDYDDGTMEVCLNVGSDAGKTSGVIYVYNRGTQMRDNLVYASYVTTASNGTLAKEIVMPKDEVGEYTVAFYADGVSLSKDFPIYNASSVGAGILKAGLDTVGRSYDEYSGELANWALSKITKSAYEGDNTAFNVKYPLSNAAEQATMRITITPPGGTKTSGRHVVKFKLYGSKADADGFVDFNRGYFTVNRHTKTAYTDGSYAIDGLVKAGKWYDIEFVFDLDADVPGSTIKVTDVESGEVVLNDSLAVVKGEDGNLNGFKNIWAYITYTANDDNDLMLFKDIQMLSDYGDVKPAIRYISNGDVVDYGQREISFKISDAEGLTEKDIYVKDKQGKVINAESISVKEDMGEYIITAKMEQDFASWQTYKLYVNAVGFEEYREYDNGSYVPVKPATREFTTPAAPLDISDPEISIDDTSVSVNAEISNSSGKSTDALSFLTVVGSDGIMKSVVADKATVPNADTGKISVDAQFEEGNTAKYFVVKSFENPVQLFGKTWTVNYDGSLPEAISPKASDVAANGEIAFDEFEYNTAFDHLNNKIVVNLNTGKNAVTDGVLYIYSGNAMSEGNLPVYADYVTTASNGTLLKEIKFASSLIEESKEYTVAFYSDALDDAIVNTFSIYTEDDYVDYKKENMAENAKKASTFSGLKQIITGTDSEGETVTDAWDIFCEEANTDTYDKLKKKEAVYIAMSSKLSSVNSFDDLVELFEKTASECYKKETSSQSSGGGASSSNKNYGSSSTVISESVATPTVTAPESNSSQGVQSVFTDLGGHWAQKHAEALFEMGVVNGYNDGSFKADSAITRAELTKIIVEALEVPSASGKTFTDVADGSWYASYVASAASAGVITGFEDGSFAPDKEVSRQDAALMIYRAVNLTKTLPTGYKFFADEENISDYASDAIRCLGDLGIITGVGNNTFKPLDSITRGEMAALICRAIDYIESHLV